MVKVVKHNLNLICLKNKKRKRIFKHTCAENEHEIIFDNIESRITELILQSETCYISCVVPYITNKSIMNALSDKRGIRMITNLGPHLKSDIRKKQISKLTNWDESEKCIVKTFSRGSGRNKTIIHSKILIGYNKDKIPLWVTNGSWNATENAKNNIENIVIHTNQFFVGAFCHEFECLWEASKNFNIRKPKTIDKR